MICSTVQYSAVSTTRLSFSATVLSLLLCSASTKETVPLLYKKRDESAACGCYCPRYTLQVGLVVVLPVLLSRFLLVALGSRVHYQRARNRVGMLNTIALLVFR